MWSIHLFCRLLRMSIISSSVSTICIILAVCFRNVSRSKWSAQQVVLRILDKCFYITIFDIAVYRDLLGISSDLDVFLLRSSPPGRGDCSTLHTGRKSSSAEIARTSSWISDDASGSGYLSPSACVTLGATANTASKQHVMLTVSRYTTTRGFFDRMRLHGCKFRIYFCTNLGLFVN